MNTFRKKIISGAISVATIASLTVPALPVGAQSFAELQAQLAILLDQIAAIQQQLNATSGGGGASVSCSFTGDLTIGATGDAVKCLQQYLNAAGFKVAASGAGSPGSETTYFGSRTAAAVKAWQAANGVSPAAGYFGPISRAKYASLVAGGGPVPGPTPTPGTGMTISLAADNPVGASVPKGATGVTFLKFNVSGNGTLNTLVFKRTGVGATGDFASAGFYIYDGATRLTTGKSINSTTHEVSFASLNVNVAGTKTLSLRGDISTTATSSNRDALRFLSGTGSVSVSGSANGNEMIIGGQTVGSLTLDNTEAPSNPNVGAQGV